MLSSGLVPREVRAVQMKIKPSSSTRQEPPTSTGTRAPPSSAGLRARGSLSRCRQAWRSGTSSGSPSGAGGSLSTSATWSSPTTSASPSQRTLFLILWLLWTAMTLLRSQSQSRRVNPSPSQVNTEYRLQVFVLMSHFQSTTTTTTTTIIITIIMMLTESPSPSLEVLAPCWAAPPCTAWWPCCWPVSCSRPSNVLFIVPWEQIYSNLTEILREKNHSNSCENSSCTNRDYQCKM